MDNATIARRLFAHADRLDIVDPNLHRRRAYRRAAETVLAEDQSVEELLQEHGRVGLHALAGIGTGLARAIEGLIRTGKIPLPRSVMQTDSEAVCMTTKEG